jgi:hypothetical protein
MRRKLVVFAVALATLLMTSGVALALAFGNTPDPGTVGVIAASWT